jgi:hypothetical protein
VTGEARQGVPVPAMNQRAETHEALKAMTDAADPAGAQAIADAWRTVANGFDEAADLFRQALLDSEQAWSGAAADAMREQLARVAKWSEATGAHYRAASDAIGTQAGAAGTAKTAMPPPVPYDPAQMIKDASGSALRLALLPYALRARKDQHDAAHEEAARVVAERDRVYGEAAAGVPEFSLPPSLSGRHKGHGKTPKAPPAPRSGSAPVSRVADDVGAIPVSYGPTAGPVARPEYLVESDTSGVYAPPVIGQE